MPQSLSTEKLAHIRTLLETDMDQKTIAQQVGVSRRQVSRIKHNILEYGSVKRPKKSLQGRPSKITEKMAEVCVHFALCFFEVKRWLNFVRTHRSL